MTRSLVVTNIADQNIDEQLIHFAGQDPDLARRFLSALYDKAFPALLRHPGMGRRWESTNPALSGVRWRLVPDFSKHMIFYRPTRTTIEILWVLYGPRDLSFILGHE